MMGRFVFKPRDLKASCESEGWGHKVKIVCFSFTMAAISGTYQSYFNDLVYRSGIYQQHALAGEADYQFMEYIDKDDLMTLWEDKNLKDVLDEKPFKELKFMHAGWKDTEYTVRRWEPKQLTYDNSNFDWYSCDNYLYTYLGQANTVEWRNSCAINTTVNGITTTTYESETRTWFDDKRWGNKNKGDIYSGSWSNGDYQSQGTDGTGGSSYKWDNEYYFTQKQRLDGEAYEQTKRQNYEDAAIIDWSAKRYSNWETMHDGVIWFDTAGCLNGRKIGDVNAVSVTATRTT